MSVDLGALLTEGGAYLVTAGFAFGGATAALNGTRKRVSEIQAALVEHVKSDAEHQRDVIDRLARIETKLEQR